MEGGREGKDEMCDHESLSQDSLSQEILKARSSKYSLESVLQKGLGTRCCSVEARLRSSLYPLHHPTLSPVERASACSSGDGDRESARQASGCSISNHTQSAAAAAAAAAAACACCRQQHRRHDWGSKRRQGGKGGGREKK